MIDCTNNTKSYNRDGVSSRIDPAWGCIGQIFMNSIISILPKDNTVL